MENDGAAATTKRPHYKSIRGGTWWSAEELERAREDFVAGRLQVDEYIAFFGVHSPSSIEKAVENGVRYIHLHRAERACLGEDDEDEVGPAFPRRHGFYVGPGDDELCALALELVVRDPSAAYDFTENLGGSVFFVVDQDKHPDLHQHFVAIEQARREEDARERGRKVPTVRAGDVVSLHGYRMLVREVNSRGIASLSLLDEEGEATGGTSADAQNLVADPQGACMFPVQQLPRGARGRLNLVHWLVGELESGEGGQER